MGLAGVVAGPEPIPPGVPPLIGQPRMGVGGVSPIGGGVVGSGVTAPHLAGSTILGCNRPPEYRGSLVRAARCLLGSVTRVLLLADTVVVKQLLLAKDKVSQ